MSEDNLVRNNNIGFIQVPLGTDAHHYAKKFAAEQCNSDKGKQVYLNTLAVYAVNRYLDWINVETDLNQSDSWQSGTRMLFNVADLVVPNIGKLECRPVMPDEKLIHLPEEVRRDRIGYVAVQFAQELDQVELLGFIPGKCISDSSEEIQLLDDLHSLDEFIGHLAAQTESKKLIALNEWLERNYPPDWFSPSELIVNDAFRRLNPKALQPSAVRAKEINLGGQLANRTLALVVRLTPISTEDIEVQVHLYPTNKSSYTDLPANVQLVVVDEKDSDFMHAQTRRFDESLCLPFSGKLGEKFGVKIVFENICLSENFMI